MMPLASIKSPTGTQIRRSLGLDLILDGLERVGGSA